MAAASHGKDRRHLRLPRPLVPMTRATKRKRYAEKSQHIVVVGAGLSGLAAAARLRASGLQVTVLEAADHVGGRCATEILRSSHGEFAADTGATVLTMPQLVESAVHALGQHMPETWKLNKLSPAYHAQFASGRSIDLYSDRARMSQAIADFAAEKFPADQTGAALRLTEGFRSYRDWSQEMFAASFENFVAADFDSLVDLVSTPAAANDLLRLTGLGAFGSLSKAIRSHIDDDELSRLFTFQALYAGQAPAAARAVYSVIGHMDTGMGVYYPQHSIGEAAEAIAGALQKAGAQVRLNCAVEDFHMDSAGTQITGVRLADGEVIPADAVICTTDLAVLDEMMQRSLQGKTGRTMRTARRAMQRSTRRANRPLPLRWSPSAVVIHGTVPTDVSEHFASSAHHTLSFGEAWEDTFTELTARKGRGRIMSDPSFLITRPARTAPSRIIRDAAGATYEPISILAPVPNLASAPIEWNLIQNPYVEEILNTLEQRGFSQLSSSLAIARVDTPATWHSEHGYGEGTPFSVAHSFSQTGPFRPRNTGAYGVDNLVLAGCGTTPGVGVPTVLVSGALAARRITGGGVR
ncbi:phytoene desaturase family protein [Corynebacterium suicordis]|uniref:Phytoene desaturase n=1 Tax=Corynebacterium suicordis DSM 45110 TaxID=1121369 RepID=A0ABR9ZK56_9CORY|nr:phytoene desaturase family protein [Corynebacterium suicordis]MBF4553820.1 phytoene desaturase [Corynebacterium suicordis DSM 45110]MDR6277203.1 phytoene desaturase [Corynebacterium suicordis]